MKQDCRNRLGQAGKSLCSTDAAYTACLTYLRSNHWDYCLRSGQAGSQAQRITPALAKINLVGHGCVEFGPDRYRCPNQDFNSSSAYRDCLAYRNGGAGVDTCLERSFLTEYADRIEQRLRGQPVGYAFVITNNAGEREERAWGVARRAPDVNPAAMTVTAPFPMASVSKTVSATAALRALRDHGLTIDAPVWSYLPKDWSIPAAFKALTFRGLLRHRTGLYAADGNRCDEKYKSVDYKSVRQCVEGATSLANADKDCNKQPIADANVIGCYQNINYALLRMRSPGSTRRSS